ncbi:hypothetical protein SDC9_173245 [bioreactor metagenome]|uniref:Uncharacterized protein n=1 Tax=bioreactor metagenome TaxID=1076179 RepID=A0A645GJ35_9ZZZZ
MTKNIAICSTVVIIAPGSRSKPGPGCVVGHIGYAFSVSEFCCFKVLEHPGLCANCHGMVYVAIYVLKSAC